MIVKQSNGFIARMVRWNLHIVFLLTFIVLFIPGYGQRSFVVNVGSTNRSYTAVHLNSNDQTKNLPLVVLAFNLNGNILPQNTTLTKAGVIVAATSQLQITAGCSNPTSLYNDMAFVETIIEDSYENFKIDRNKVYIVGDVSSACLIDSIIHRKGTAVNTVRMTVRETIEQVIARTVSLTQVTSNSPQYEVWKYPLYDPILAQRHYEDSIKRNRWEGRTSVEFRMGRFDMLGLVKTGSDKTYMDVSDSHVMMDLHINHYISDSISWFVDIGRLKVPQRQETSGVRIEMGGGMILSLTYGLKYTFYRSRLRPYLMIGTGPLSFMVFGGRFSMNSDPAQVKNKIDAEVRMAMQTKIGTGMESRVGRRIAVGVHVAYIHSSEFKPAGSVNAMRGFYNSVSVGYILGTNKIKK